MVEERYEIRGKIGQGGVGAVYKAYDTQLRREVAIKRVLADEEDKDNETATNNLLQEATALSSVQHPHICTVYDSGIDEDGPFVVMELINGKTLDEMVERGTLTYEDFREVAIQTQEAMIAAQELNLVHRDLKPSNVMVSWLPSGRFQIKLVDFGLAKFSAKPSLQTIDHGDAVFGSIFFMAPEQFERTALDQRTDMYSLGAMYYYALTGNYPFDGDTAPQVMASHLQNSVTPLHQVRPDLPTWLCEWVTWHIQKEMDHRPASAKLALEKFLSDESLAAQGGSATPQLITPGVPVLKQNLVQTGAQAIRPAGSSTGELNTGTSPQPILSPDGKPSSSTAPVGIQPAGNVGSAPVAVSSPADQSNPTATGPQILTPTKKPINKTLIIVIGSMLVVAIIIMIFVIFGAKEKKKHNETYLRLIDGIQDKKTLPVTKAELDNLLTSMTMPTIKDKTGGQYALGKAVATDDSFSPTLEIVKFISIPDQNIKDESMKRIIIAISWNPSHDPEAHKLLLKYALKNPNKAHSATAISNMKKFADDSYINDILAIHDNTEEFSTRNSCAITLTEIIKRSKSKNTIADKIISKYNSAQDEAQKLAYLRLLGTTGSRKALRILTTALQSDDATLKLAAFKSLSTSPTIEPFEAMLKGYAVESENKSLSKKLREAIFSLLNTNAEMPDQKKSELWTKLFNSSSTDYGKRHVIDRISRGDKSEWAIQMLKGISTSSDYSKEVKSFAKERLETLRQK